MTKRARNARAEVRAGGSDPVGPAPYTAFPRTPPGMVLLVVLLLLLALSSLAAGMLWLASTQSMTSAMRAQHLRLRLRTEAAALDAFDGWQTPRPRHPLGETWVLRDDTAPTGGATVLADRLTPTLTLLRVTSVRRVPGGPAAVMRLGLLVRTVEPDELLPAFPAALTAGNATLDGGAIVDASAPRSPPDGWFAADCSDDGVAALDSLYGGELPGIATPRADGVQRDETSHLRGQPPVFVAPGLTEPRQTRLGPIPWSMVPEIADLTVGGTLQPEPAQTRERCIVERPDNWGQPGGVGPCSLHAPLIYAPHGIVMAGGVGQGILVVQGDATLRDGARFYGAVIASGDLLVSDSARLSGAARAGTATIRGATVRYRVCPLWRAALQARALRRAFRPEGRWWLPDYPRAP
jgi:hypothetical protein